MGKRRGPKAKLRRSASGPIAQAAEIKSLNRESARFCENCAARLSAACSECGQATAPGSRFCDACGAPLLASPEEDAMLARLLSGVPDHLAAKIASEGRAVSGERKSVTIMFADISGFTALSERLDPEEVVEIINQCFAKLAQIVYSYEGTIDKYIGDCIMALFGAPITHEDDAERAVRASLDMREALAQLSSELNVELSMHTGINTGTVIAVNVGSDLRMQYTVVGDAVNVAARLQSIARANQILVGEGVYRLTQHAFDYAERGDIVLKGRAEPVVAYEPTTALRRQSRLEVAQQQVFSRSPLPPHDRCRASRNQGRTLQGSGADGASGRDLRQPVLLRAVRSCLR